jgi:GR25 family glycosyltransferase involved in LPS biosynthesis
MNLRNRYCSSICVGSLYCLNLKRRLDRRLTVSVQFRRQGLKVSVLSAPDAAIDCDMRGWRNKGARACALGHRMAWRAGKKALAEQVMVFEDDVGGGCGEASAVRSRDRVGGI